MEPWGMAWRLPIYTIFILLPKGGLSLAFSCSPGCIIISHCYRWSCLCRSTAEALVLTGLRLNSFMIRGLFHLRPLTIILPECQSAWKALGCPTFGLLPNGGLSLAFSCSPSTASSSTSEASGAVSAGGLPRPFASLTSNWEPFIIK